MAKTFLEMLAPAEQEVKSGFCDLHHRCNGSKAAFSICTDGARSEKWFLRFAPPVQAFPKALWPLTACDQRHSSEIRTSFLRLTHVVHKITYFLLAVACKMRLNSQRQREMRRNTRFACRRQVEMRFSGLIPYVCP